MSGLQCLKHPNTNTNCAWNKSFAHQCSLNGVIDWTVPAAREMAINKFPASIISIIQDLCQFKEYEYTPECKSLVTRLTGEDKSIMAWHKELLKPHEFTDKAFDPLDHQDWDYVKFMTEHFLKIDGSTDQSSRLGERTAVSYASQPIIDNHLWLTCAFLSDAKNGLKSVMILPRVSPKQMNWVWDDAKGVLDCPVLIEKHALEYSNHLIWNIEPFKGNMVDY
ncbi:uncharacterized protein EV154DRAFT_134419 [Mucor mucedo]|uniref:uncharacterized protein n=1 Tax=Mucor mucedo TaxID=29922 RepID=UPI0022205FA9|nr:uncharacterized protein EV154DRAFT_134419 [Mucor mucedo]KAI7868657.1 hypothetical protein EV154DRAFT_134419 [Mucor mucedo]